MTKTNIKRSKKERVRVTVRGRTATVDLKKNLGGQDHHSSVRLKLASLHT